MHFRARAKGAAAKTSATAKPEMFVQNLRARPADVQRGGSRKRGDFRGSKYRMSRTATGRPN